MTHYDVLTDKVSCDYILLCHEMHQTDAVMLLSAVLW